MQKHTHAHAHTHTLTQAHAQARPHTRTVIAVIISCFEFAWKFFLSWARQIVARKDLASVMSNHAMQKYLNAFVSSEEFHWITAQTLNILLYFCLFVGCLFPKWGESRVISSESSTVASRQESISYNVRSTYRSLSSVTHHWDCLHPLSLDALFVCLFIALCPPSFTSPPHKSISWSTACVTDRELWAAWEALCQ